MEAMSAIWPTAIALSRVSMAIAAGLDAAQIDHSVRQSFGPTWVGRHALHVSGLVDAVGAVQQPRERHTVRSIAIIVCGVT